MYEYPVVGSCVRSVGAWGRDNVFAIDCGKCIEQAAHDVEASDDDAADADVGPGG